MKTKRLTVLALLLTLVLLITGCDLLSAPAGTTAPTTTAATTAASTTAPVTTAPAPDNAETIDAIPPYAGIPYVTIAGGVPAFTPDEIAAAATSYEYFSPLDSLGRCGVVHASVGIDLMPTEDRGSIGMVKPSGWQTAKYDIVSGKYLYNRCHLIGFQLTGENANEENLITGTRYMNVDGMLPFENMVADYVKETENHVLYRVTPLYRGGNLVADGVTIEAYSVEDEGDGICFFVYVYNVQPGITINYADGTSYLSSEPPITTALPTTTVAPPVTTAPAEEPATYIVNTNTDKFHKETCRYAEDIAPQNRDVYVGTRSYLIEVGFEPCGSCKP